MERSTNALAELADFMSQEVYAYWNNGSKPRQEKLKKIQRIVAELAKFQPEYALNGLEMESLVQLENRYFNIRAIAKEGDGDGK